MCLRHHQAFLLGGSRAAHRQAPIGDLQCMSNDCQTPGRSSEDTYLHFAISRFARFRAANIKRPADFKISLVHLPCVEAAYSQHIPHSWTPASIEVPLSTRHFVDINESSSLTKIRGRQPPILRDAASHTSSISFEASRLDLSKRRQRDHRE
jgi:hypothetical protein